MSIDQQAALNRPAEDAAAGASPPGLQPRPKLVFLVTEDWAFWSHRLPMARAARDAGFEVVVATRVREHGARIRAERFKLCPVPWRRRGDGFVGALRAIAAIVALYRRERPHLVHHVALKPVLFGGLAARLAFPRRGRRPRSIASVNGLGSGLVGAPLLAQVGRWVLGCAMRWMTRGGPVIVQNRDDGKALRLDPAHLALIRGSGVDTGHFTPLPEAEGPAIRVALVARMLRSKGVPDAVAAVRRLRAQGVPIELILAGPTDPDNRDSFDEPELLAFVAEPGIEWLGWIEDVRTVWARAAIAVFPSTYGEGVPKALLEAAACARPIVAADMPGCREIVRDGENGLLVPPGDIDALAAALAELAADPARRQAMGRAGRVFVEREFADERVARETLAIYQRLLRDRDVAR